jgi:hypothetical protein
MFCAADVWAGMRIAQSLTEVSYERREKTFFNSLRKGRFRVNINWLSLLNKILY